MAEDLFKHVHSIINLLTNPKGGLFVLLIYLFVDLYLRLNGVDLLAVAFSNLGVSDVPNMAGKWKYRSFAFAPDIKFDHGGCGHEGELSISQNNTNHYGPKISIAGERQSILYCDQTGQLTTITALPRPISWETVDGIVTSSTAMQFHHDLRTSNGLGEAFVWGEISKIGDKPNKFVGNFFYELPSNKLFWGKIELDKVAD